MIIRISGDAQYRVNDSVLDRINAVDDELEAAVHAGDEEHFARELKQLMALVRDTGERLGDDHLAPSKLILPPDDISLAEIAGQMSTDGLIPD